MGSEKAVEDYRATRKKYVIPPSKCSHGGRNTISGLKMCSVSCFCGGKNRIRGKQGGGERD